MPILTVSQINRYISFRLKDDRNLKNILVRGEISDFSEHFKTGNLYFNLKEGQCRIKSVMFSNSASRLKFRLENGMAVIVSGSVSIFERDGISQIYVNDIIPDGKGEDITALEKLKRKLYEMGIFSETHKRKIPSMPKKIGVVTAESGAAIRDIINVISRRYPICELVIINTLVQGKSAPDSICQGLKRAEELECDVVILARGGGNSEDLSAFNTEKTALAIYNCQIPVISAVGHEIDFTIADMTADLRSPTPSAGAECAVPDKKELMELINSCEHRLKMSIRSIISSKSLELENIYNTIVRNSPENRLKINFEKLENLERHLRMAYTLRLEYLSSQLNQLMGSIENLSPFKIMLRGYSLVYDEDGRILTDSDNLKEGDLITIKFKDSEISAEIKNISEKKRG